MKVSELSEMPELISDLDSSNIDTLRKFCQNAVNSGNAELVEKITKTVNLYKTTNYYFLYSNKVEYMAEFKKVEQHEKLLPQKFGIRQVLIKRFGNTFSSAGIGQKIFWDYLFPEYGALVSDTQQTLDGKKFWLYRIKEALEKNLTVRFINTATLEFTDIKTAQQMDDLDPYIWGSSKWFQQIILVIME